MTAKEWTRAYAVRLGAQPPTPAELSQVLDLAAEAAHASERTAAPVACWMSARAGVPLDRALELAREVTADQAPGGSSRE